ncbi:MAG: 16S rRNA (cytidine(1402)-2'-O)-methyltransferase [Chitinispirillia bacterium]|nr:16S rRNA (cytidine(1402)-2'-O)-methyltransferase [Chitinispirillia bacterium]MCL2242530.1 16S rRNA (cytidine(1402)-2'-O)-methyltransferase [Chitinispirillia bacterium]
MSLYIVSTPIGNLGDITVRASKILAECDLILAEDTRTSKKLLDHLGINKPMTAYHDFNKEKITPQLITSLKSGSEIALITDAGTPGVADPAFYIVRASIANGINVIPIPGASACLAALVASGLPTDRFTFENFLPNKSTQRRKLFEGLKDEPRTVIFYETPHRIIKTLEDIRAVLPGVNVVIARELTKIHEQFLRGTAEELLAHFNGHPPKGEMVILFNTRIQRATATAQ